ncbi:Cadherin-related family member 4 [Gossypium australe]|uniref:Cadherin-related family member 4 n=1 Tax=Gossypium australe TaxID=47621 RepID=A0A5B6UTK4_9ROSI|nr:Cadherin-related family member 4 [Gossypium australe]
MVFEMLVEKIKIVEEIKQVEHKKWEKSKVSIKRDSSSTTQIVRVLEEIGCLSEVSVGGAYSKKLSSSKQASILGVEKNTTNVIVVSPLRQVVVVNKIYRRCPLECFSADIMKLPFREFDLIMRMDWLVEHQVSLDCASKRVPLKTAEACEIIMVRERRNHLSNEISTMVAKKLV